MTSQDALVRVRGLSKNFVRGSETVHVLDSLDLDIVAGDALSVDWQAIAQPPVKIVALPHNCSPNS